MKNKKNLEDIKIGSSVNEIDAARWFQDVDVHQLTDRALRNWHNVANNVYHDTIKEMHKRETID